LYDDTIAVLKRVIYINKCLFYKNGKISNQEIQILLKKEKEEQLRTQINKRKEIIKVKAEINEINRPKYNRKKLLKS
jgi:hypothetical protein